MIKQFYFWTLLLFVSCSDSNQVVHTSNSQNYNYIEDKVNGISMVSPREHLSSNDFAPLPTNNFNWVAISPFAFVRKNSSNILYNTPFQWKSEQPKGIEIAINSAQQQQLKVMLKPQLWGHDLFTGDINFNQEKDWLNFEEGYRKYIMQMALLADSCGVEIFCIGTELANFVAQRPLFWQNLIKEIKKNYSGKLTYAENWDKVNIFPFWSELDYIGSDAYYPLSSSDTPSISELNKGWGKWCKHLAQLSDQVSKKVLFTEWGYRSIIKNAHEPWEHGEAKPVSLENQTRAYRSYFESVYNQEWYAGGFLWKWYPEVHGLPLQKDGFTPQGKPALDVFTSLKKK